jgi:large subunit ribosomal protein L5e
VLKKYIYGGHVAEYMEEMEEEDPEKYNRHFAGYIDEGLSADDLEELYTKVHAAIRANPLADKKARSKPAEAKRWQPAKSTYEERKERLKAKLATLKDADDE